jgi:hypothetical protein
VTCTRSSRPSQKQLVNQYFIKLLFFLVVAYTKIMSDTPSPTPSKRKSLIRRLLSRRSRTSTASPPTRGKVLRLEFATAFLSVISAILGLGVAVLGVISYNATQQKQAAQSQTRELKAENTELMKQIADSDQNAPKASGPRVSALFLEMPDSSYATVGLSLDTPTVGEYKNNEIEYEISYDTRQPTLEFASDIKASIALAYASKPPTRKLCADAIASAPTSKPVSRLSDGMYICVKTYAKGIALLTITQAPTATDQNLHLQETYWAP